MLSAIATANGMLLSMSATSITDESDPFWASSQLAYFLTGTGAPVNLLVLALGLTLNLPS